MPANATKEAIHQAVQSAYGAVARTRNKSGENEAACCGPTCCGKAEADQRPLTDYTPEELASVPKGAYLGEGSGVPVRHAGLKPGEVVVDLGSGAGMDSFLAANAVGPRGRVHGFDLTSDMLERARENASAAGGKYAHVSFDRADIEHLPLPDASADAAISNCVINLTPDKAAVYRGIFRVLRSGGRLSVADIVVRGKQQDVDVLREKLGAEGWCACLTGALREEDYLGAIRAAGFRDVRIVAERPAQFQPGSGVTAAAVTITAKK